MRVVSLLPAATELCYALGVEPVGVSHECDYPPSARDTTMVTRTPVAGDGDGAAINEQVARAAEIDGVFDIRVDVLADLDPDLVLTQGTCDVCAVDATLADAALERAGVDATVLPCDVHCLADLYRDIERVAAALGRESRGETLVTDLRDRVAAVERATRAVENRPRVAVLDWLDPVMVAGHWIPELVDAAGGRYGLADTGARSRPVEWARIRADDPDVLIAAPCGFDLEQIRATRDDLLKRSHIGELAASPDRIVAMDGDSYVNRPGPRLVETLEHLAGLVHPDRFEDPPASVAHPLTDARSKPRDLSG